MADLMADMATDMATDTMAPSYICVTGERVIMPATVLHNEICLGRRGTMELSNWENIISCPITCDYFKDPVLITSTGNTYDRGAIMKWIMDKNSDPLTNLEINMTDIIPNYALVTVLYRLEMRDGDLWYHDLECYQRFAQYQAIYQCSTAGNTLMMTLYDNIVDQISDVLYGGYMLRAVISDTEPVIDVSVHQISIKRIELNCDQPMNTDTKIPIIFTEPDVKGVLPELVETFAGFNFQLGGPRELLRCPLSGRPFSDPVMTLEGVTYDRSYLDEYSKKQFEKPDWKKLDGSAIARNLCIKPPFNLYPNNIIKQLYALTDGLDDSVSQVVSTDAFSTDAFSTTARTNGVSSTNAFSAGVSAGGSSTNAFSAGGSSVTVLADIIADSATVGDIVSSVTAVSTASANSTVSATITPKVPIRPALTTTMCEDYGNVLNYVEFIYLARVQHYRCVQDTNKNSSFSLAPYSEKDDYDWKNIKRVRKIMREMSQKLQELSEFAGNYIATHEAGRLLGQNKITEMRADLGLPDMREMSFLGTDLSFLNLSKIRIVSIRFDDCAFYCTNFTDALFHDCMFYQCKFTGAIFTNCVFVSCQFSNCEMEYKCVGVPCYIDDDDSSNDQIPDLESIDDGEFRE